MITDKNKEFLLTFGDINVEDHLKNDFHIIAHRPALEDRHIEHFVNNSDPKKRAIIARRRYLNPKHIDRLIRDPDKFVSENATAEHHPEMNKSQIDHVFKQGTDESKSWIANHHLLDRDQIDAFVDHKDPDVRYTVSKHPNLSDTHIRKLATDPYFDVRLKILDRDDCPHDVVKQMTKDSDEYIRDSARKKLKEWP